MKVLNFGSLNIDYVYNLDHIVRPGETITSKSLTIFPGGKGLNQSVALARAGAKVYHAGLIGKDGCFLKEVCAESGVCVDYINQIDTRTGNAIIQVTDCGQNSIVLYAGANRKNTKVFVDEVLEDFEEKDTLLLQNEVNLIDYLIEAGSEKGMTIMLNPSPYDKLLEQCDLSKVDVFIMNEVEGEQISGEKESEKILKFMRETYPNSKVVLTLGERGSIYNDKNHTYIQEIVPVQAVDTTAAGDTFTGYYIAAVIEGKSEHEALELAAKAAAIAVSRKGASGSIPVRSELDKLY